MFDEVKKIISYTLRIDKSQVKKDIAEAQKDANDAAKTTGGPAAAQPAPTGPTSATPPPIPINKIVESLINAVRGRGGATGRVVEAVSSAARSRITGAASAAAQSGGAAAVSPAVAASAARLGITPSMITGAGAAGAGGAGAGGVGAAVGGAASAAGPLLPIAAGAIAAGLYLQQLGKSIKGVIGGGRQIGRSIFTGNTVQGVSGVMGVGAGMARAFGTGAGGALGGWVVGGIADKLKDTVTSILESLDQLAKGLAKYNPILFAQQREVERMQRMLKIQVAERMRPLLTAWNDIQKKFLEILSKIVATPAFGMIIKLLTALLKPLEWLLDLFEKFVDIITEISKAVLNVTSVVVRAFSKLADFILKFVDPFNFSGLQGSGERVANAFDEWIKDTFGDTTKPKASLAQMAAQWNQSFLDSMRVNANPLNAGRAGGRGRAQANAINNAAGVGAGGGGGGGAGGFIGQRPAEVVRANLARLRRFRDPADVQFFINQQRRKKEFDAQRWDFVGLGKYGSDENKIRIMNRHNNKVSDHRSVFGGGDGGGAGGEPAAPAPIPRAKAPEYLQNVTLNFKAMLQHERAVSEAMHQARDHMLREMGSVRNETLLLAAQMDGESIARMM